MAAGRHRGLWRNATSTAIVPESENDTPWFYNYPDDPDSGTAFGAFNGGLQYRNSFYWDRKAMESYTGSDSTAAAADYAVARIYHWQHEDGGLCSGDLESYEEPLRNRVFFHPYQQSRGLSRLPQFAGAVVEEATSGTNHQYVRYSYNALGLMTRRLVHAAPGGLQPSFRQTDFVYDSNNLIDLLRVTQRNGASDELLLNVVYATGHPHLPGTITDAAGKNWNFTYTSSKHQLETITNPKSETTTFSYDANGYLTNIVGAQVGATTKLSYVGFGRVRTVTDSEAMRSPTIMILWDQN